MSNFLRPIFLNKKSPRIGGLDSIKDINSPDYFCLIPYKILTRRSDIRVQSKQVSGVILVFNLQQTLIIALVVFVNGCGLFISDFVGIPAVGVLLNI